MFIIPDLSSALIFSALALGSECLCVSDVRAQLAAMISRAILNKAPYPQSASIVMTDEDQEPCVSTPDDIKSLSNVVAVLKVEGINCSLQFNFLCKDAQIQSSKFCLIYINV